jgi:hypothetical protein
VRLLRNYSIKAIKVVILLRQLVLFIISHIALALFSIWISGLTTRIAAIAIILLVSLKTPTTSRFI